MSFLKKVLKQFSTKTSRDTSAKTAEGPWSGVWVVSNGSPTVSEKDLGGDRDFVDHYASTRIETVDYIYDKLGPDGGLDYVLGNILKYASRARHKGQLESDLRKIRNYATIALQHLEEGRDVSQ